MILTSGEIIELLPGLISANTEEQARTTRSRRHSSDRSRHNQKPQLFSRPVRYLNGTKSFEARVIVHRELRQVTVEPVNSCCCNRSQTLLFLLLPTESIQVLWISLNMMSGVMGIQLQYIHSEIQRK